MSVGPTNSYASNRLERQASNVRIHKKSEESPFPSPIKQGGFGKHLEICSNIGESPHGSFTEDKGFEQLALARVNSTPGHEGELG